MLITARRPSTAARLLGSTAIAMGLAFLAVQPAAAADCVAQADGPWSDPATWDSCAGGVPGAGNSADIGFRTVTLPGSETVGSLLHTNGIIQGPGDLTVSGAATITGGSQTGGGTTTVEGTTTIGEASPFFNTFFFDIIDGRTLQLEGDTRVQGARVFLSLREQTPGAGSGQLINALGATFTDDTGLESSPGSSTLDISGVGGLFVNEGAFVKTGFSSTSIISVDFDNTGSVSVEQGTLSLTADSTHVGAAIDVASGGRLEVGNGFHLFDGVTVTGEGPVAVTSGTLQVETPTAFGGLEVSGGTLALNAPVSATSFLQSFGAVQGPGDLTVSGSATITGASQTGGGTTTLEGPTAIGEASPFIGSVNSFRFDLIDGRTLRLEGDTVVEGSRVDLFLREETAGAGSGLLVNALGAVFTDNSGSEFAPFFGALSISGEGGRFLNEGAFVKVGDGAVSRIDVAFDNTGSVAVERGELNFSNGDVAQHVGDALTGGEWRVVDSGDGAQITFQSSGGADAIARVGGDVTLDGAGARMVSTPAVGGIPLDIEDSLTTIEAGGALRVLGGRDFAAANALTNDGLIQLGGGTLDAPALDNAATGEIAGFGAIAPTVVNSGTVRATDGVLTAEGGVSGPGAVIAEAGATMALGAPSSAGVLDLRGGALALDGNDIVVSGDYDNAAFGVGNDFNGRANVSGAGRVLGENVAIAVTGDAVQTGRDSWTLDFGVVRSGGEETRSFAIANTGAGADIRGALQVADGFDPRFSGSGVTAQNFGPVAAGAETGSFSVTFGGSGGGAVAGTIGVVSNFDNLAAQTILLDGFISNLAIGQATPTTSVDLGAFRVGLGAPSQSFAVANLTDGDGAESLGVGSATASGPFAATNVLGADLVAPGATRDDAVAVALSGGAAGVNTGTLSIQYVSDGTAFDPSLTAIDSNLQTVALSATGYALAAGDVAPDPVTVSNQRVGGTETAALAVSNTAAAGAFTEGLNAAFTGATGEALTNGGTVALLEGGASDNTSLRVGVDTAQAGTRSGTVTVGFESDGTGTSGFTPLAVGAQTVTVTGDVFAVAEGQLNTAPLNFGTVQVGQAVSRTLSISNIAEGPEGFVEDLNARFGAASGLGASRITGTGAVAGLIAGGTDAASMSVSVDTATAGSVDGAIAVDFFSAGAVAGVSNGLGEIGVGSTDFIVAGIIEALALVVDQASPVINTPQPIDLGAVRLGATSPVAGVSVTNAATGNDQAALSASITGLDGVTASGSFSLLAPDATDAASLSVGLDTSVAGAVAGTARIAFVSDASNVGGCEPDCALDLPSQDVGVTGAVYRLADPLLAPDAVTLAARRGDAAPETSLAVTNQSPDGFTEALGATLGAAPDGFSAAGAIAGLAAGATDATSLTVALDTTAAGVFAGDLTVDFVSTGAGTTGAADVSVGAGSVALTGRVWESAVADVAPVVDFGIVHVGDVVASRGVAISNTAPVAGLNDTLAANFVAQPGGPFSVGGAVAGLAAGATDATSMTVALDTSAAGVFSFDGDLIAARSMNPDLADKDLGVYGLGLLAQVNNFANPVFTQTGGAGRLSGGGLAFELDFGSILLGTDPLTVSLAVTNDIFGPADFLRGSFDISGATSFSLGGFEDFMNIGAGDSFDGLTVGLSALSTGRFAETIFLSAIGFNASGFEGAFDPIALTLKGEIRSDVPAPIPVPAPFALLVSGLAMLWGLRRRVTRA